MAKCSAISSAFDLVLLSLRVLRSPLSICTFLQSDVLRQSITEYLGGDRYVVTQISSEGELIGFLQRQKGLLDCLIVQDSSKLPQLLEQLSQRYTLLPLVVVQAPPMTSDTDSRETAKPVSADWQPTGAVEQYDIYYKAAVEVSVTQLSQIPRAIERAIAEFLKLSPSIDLSDNLKNAASVDELTNQSFLKLQQQRLAEKLKERLGYLGVYYKRDPKNFFRHLPNAKKRELIEILKKDYREVILNYFSNDNKLNQQIDELVNLCFFADISVSQIVEIHMELMDEFSKQLQLEGRREEILLDYRLTLIDTIAHLCEMYRRSIPRES